MWYTAEHAMNFDYFFYMVGKLFSMTFNAMMGFSQTDLFRAFFAVILLGLVASFVIYLLKGSNK